MSEQDNSPAEVDRAPAALDFARAYYAGALLAARHRPDDLHRQQRAEEAWNEYREAAEKAGQSSTLLPSGFAQKPD
jgi:hypothetical protein